MNASKSVVLYMNVTAHLDTIPDQGLLSKKGGRGFPYIALMNANGDVLWEFRPSDQGAFDQAHKWAKKLNGVKAKAALAPENKALAANATLLDACSRQQRGQTKSFAELEKCAAVKGVDAEILTMYKPKRIEMAMNAARSDGGKSVYELYKAGAKPEGRQKIGFYYFGARGAIAAKDAENGNKLVDLFEAEGAKNERFKERAKADAAKMRDEIKAFSQAK